VAALAVLLKHRLYVFVKRDGRGSGEQYPGAEDEKKSRFQLTHSYH
jgi:hypothetical protein